MRCCNLRRMVFWFLVLLTIFPEVTVHAIPSSSGFISIDCGIDTNTNYTDNFTGLTYVSDDRYIDTGLSLKISSQYPVNRSKFNTLTTVRSFPSGIKNCYTLQPVTAGSNYLVRATFYYGNYDKLSHIPIFDIYFGVNYWDTIYLSSEDSWNSYETISTASADYVQFCLINTGQGTPFISALELRPFTNGMHYLVNSSQSLVLDSRLNYGSSSNPLIRYPDDPLDRLWLDNTQQPWTEISTTNVVKTDTSFLTPSRVLQTAAASSTITDSLDLLWTLDASNNFFALLHISEIQALKPPDYRAFNIYANGELLFNDSYVPEYLQSGWVNFTSKGKTNYNVSFKATKNSTLPPIINAFELYLIVPLTLLPTYPDDVTIVTTIKAHYGVNKGWSGDPCVPTWLAWFGVNCTLNASKISRITSLNLSSSGLTGTIISSFGNLTALQSLDLSRNNLLGTIPISLDQLTLLTFLDLSRNDKLNFTLPPGLQIRKDNGLLIVKTTEDPTDSSSVCSGRCDKKKISVTIIVIVVVIPLLVITSIVILVLCWKRITNNIRINQHHGTLKNYGHLGDIVKDSHGIPKRHGTEESILHFESRKFTFVELKTLTNNFQDKIGTGGFGSVFMGCLENRKQVAVKVLSQSSSQGVKEFMAEAQNLTRVHHKNLVSLFGYCMDGDHMALVYEYMPEGTLQDKLRDSGRPLAWNQWLRIAQESAQGLEYLHKSCNPPLIHRDIKSSNILLTANLEAKIADFGLVRAFDSDGTHITTRVVGTPGYFDPDYYTTSQLTEKSDVYSFGVVLLEIATGQPPIIGGKQHITELVRQKLFEGDLESIIHERFEGHYDINSIQKVAKLGLKCTGEATRRPTMTGVVAELKECMKLEMSSEWIDGVVSGETIYQYNYWRNDNLVSDVSHDGILEMDYMDRTSVASNHSVR